MEDFKKKMFLVYRTVIEETYAAHRKAADSQSKFERVQCKAAAIMGERLCRVLDVATADNTTVERLEEYVNNREYKE